MSVFNRRNVAVGWVAVLVGKRVLKKKAKDAVPKIDTEAKRPNKPAIVASLLAVGAGLMFWRKKSSGDDSPPTD